MEAVEALAPVLAAGLPGVPAPLPAPDSWGAWTACTTAAPWLLFLAALARFACSNLWKPISDDVLLEEYTKAGKPHAKHRDLYIRYNHVTAITAGAIILADIALRRQTSMMKTVCIGFGWLAASFISTNMMLFSSIEQGFYRSVLSKVAYVLMHSPLFAQYYLLFGAWGWWLSVGFGLFAGSYVVAVRHWGPMQWARQRCKAAHRAKLRREADRLAGQGSSPAAAASLEDAEAGMAQNKRATSQKQHAGGYALWMGCGFVEIVYSILMAFIVGATLSPVTGVATAFVYTFVIWAARVVLWGRSSISLLPDMCKGDGDRICSAQDIIEHHPACAGIFEACSFFGVTSYQWTSQVSKCQVVPRALEPSGSQAK